MIEIVITDDHPVVRMGLRRILEDNPDMRVTADFGSAAELLEFLRNHSCNILLLDISMPGRSGLDLLADIKMLQPSIQVLILSIYSEEFYALRAIRSGAAGYITKSSNPEVLIDAIRRISQGRKFITLPLAEQLLNKAGIDRLSHHELSNRELEVLRLLAEGNSPGEIAEKLSLSIKTVSTYRSRILLKMNLKNTSEIIRYAIGEGLIS